MRALCDWLAIGFEPVMTQPSMMGVSWSNNSSFTERPSGVDPLPERHTVLSAVEREYLVWALKPFQQCFGYSDCQ
jgi:hypothetical protein